MDYIIKNVNAIYSGGGVWILYGTLNKGCFLVSDYGDVRIIDENPSDNWDMSLYAEWQRKHFIEDLEGKALTDFREQLIKRLHSPQEQDDLGGLTDEEIDRNEKLWNYIDTL